MKTLFVTGAILWTSAAWLGVYNSAWIIGAGLVAFSSYKLATRDR